MFDQHKHGVLFFSAGKDSLACLLLLKPFWDRLTVVWSNPGAPHAETVAYMERIKALVPHFVEVTGEQPANLKRFGWPVDVLPVKSSAPGALGAGMPEVRMQSYMDCCSRNLWDPMRRYLAEHKPSLVIMGQRKEESLRNRLRDAEVSVIEGVTYWHPLHDWTADQVVTYIESKGEDLPPFYRIGAESSADCWNCTAYIDHNRSRLKYLKRERPEMFAQIAPVLSALRQQINAHNLELSEVLDAHQREYHAPVGAHAFAAGAGPGAAELRRADRADQP